MRVKSFKKIKNCCNMQIKYVILKKVNQKKINKIIIINKKINNWLNIKNNMKKKNMNTKRD